MHKAVRVLTLFTLVSSVVSASVLFTIQHYLRLVEKNYSISRGLVTPEELTIKKIYLPLFHDCKYMTHLTVTIVSVFAIILIVDIFLTVRVKK
jgi:hypothetical protein